MNARSHINGRLACLLICAILAQVSSTSADVFTGIAALRDSLRAWESAPPAADTSLVRGHALAELFPGAELTSVGPDQVRVVLPPLWGEQFAATLRVAGAGAERVFSVDMELVDSLVVLDGRVVEGLATDTTQAALRDYARRMLVALRTLAVPGKPSTLGARQAPVAVTLVGRDIDRFAYTLEAWWRCWQQLAAGMQVYAFLLDVAADESEAVLDWAVFLRAPGAPSQHLLHFQEYLTRSPELRLDRAMVRIIPGVRLDNLDALFGSDEQRLSTSRWKLYLDE